MTKTQKNPEERDGLKVGELVRDTGSLGDLWGRILDFDADDFALFAPLNGSEPYGVPVEVLSKNAYHDHRKLS